MKATKIYYQKCFNLGNYQNEVIGIELEVEAGEKASKVMEMARHFVNSESVSRATGKQVKEAREFLEKNTGELELPF